MTPREQEIARLYEAVNLIVDRRRLLFVCLSGANPNDACGLNYGPFDDDAAGTIPEALKGRAQVLYKIAGNELTKFASQVLCLAVEEYLGTVMTSPELSALKANTPMKFPIKDFGNILEELADGDPGVAEWLVQQPKQLERTRAGRATRFFPNAALREVDSITRLATLKEFGNSGGVGIKPK